MLNQIVLVGRITKDLEVKEEDNKKVSNITIAIPRSFKNSDGEYETDFINCVLYNMIAENTAEYCRKGDIVGVIGRLQSKTIEKENGEREYIMEVIAEKVTFLSGRSNKESEEE